jgi:glutamyl-tRNA synthetase
VPAYQLAVVVDDARQGITQITRGDDLLDSTARQILVARALGLDHFNPRYLHLPLVRGPDGRRLAKRHGDSRLASYRAAGVLPSRVVGLLASWSGVLPRRSPAPMDAHEFRRRLDLTRIPRASITFSPEDAQWLLADARSR